MPVSLSAAARAAMLGLCTMTAVPAVSAPLPEERIADDPELTRMVEETRAEFLARRPFDRLNATVLIPSPEGGGTWLRGSYGADELQYPASCVKLPFLAAAMHWSRENGLPYDHLDEHLRPMIEVSDNVATGHVMDAISGTTNFQEGETGAPPYGEWLEMRRYAERALASRGLLGNQSMVTKTYPTNTGDTPNGYEGRAREELGANMLQAGLSASLMLDIVTGGWEQEATEYMGSLLEHPRYSPHSAFGPAIPPGSVYLNKYGVAYDTLEEIAYVKFPNGREAILSVFTNGRDRTEDEDYYVTMLSAYAELVFERLGMYEGTGRIVLDNEDEQFSASGPFSQRENKGDGYGPSFLTAPANTEASAVALFEVPAPGKYEVCVWWSDGPDRSDDARFTIHHDRGPAILPVDQQKRGGVWVRLGEYSFTEGGMVSIAPGASSPAALTVADAIRLFPAAEPDGD
ncbi:MAG: serine hydrolase [Sumerlaeia bacterium]